MLHRSIFGVILSLWAVVSLAPLPVFSGGVSSNPSEKQLIDVIWRSARWDIEKQMHSGLSKQSAVVLYSVQIQTNMLLEHAAAWDDRDILDDLAELFLVAFDHLELRETYRPAFHPKGPDLPLAPPAKMWLEADGTLSQLHVSQFLYLLSRTVCIICDVDPQDRTDAMKRLLASYVPVLTEHYTRWVCGEHGAFSNGFGGERELMNHRDYLKRKLERSFPGPKLSNALVGWDMWIIGGVVELLGAHRRDPALVTITAQERRQLLGYVRLATALLKSRLTRNRLTDFAGKLAIGLNFDIEQWDDGRDSAYSGYTGAIFPSEKDKARARHVGYDISHARRFIHVFETLLRHRNVTGQAFPTRETLTGLTNQLIYGTFNRNFDRPLFTNFMSGANGWYRVGSRGKSAFGYAPYHLSNSVPTAGYLTWAKYNPDVGRASKALWKMIRTTMAGFVVDVSGHRHHAMCSGVTRTERDGGPAFQFDAGNGCIDGGISTGLCMARGTVEFRFKLNTVFTHHDLFYLFEKPYKDFFTVSRNSKNLLYLMIEDDNVQKFMVYREEPVSDTDWHHLAVIQDGSCARMILDGVPCKLKGTNSGYWTKHLVHPRLWIGKGHLKKNLGGCIDDVRIYDRALSDDEVAAHSSKSLPDIDDGLIVCWNGHMLPTNRKHSPELVAFLDEYYSGAGTVSQLRKPFSSELLQFLASMSVARVPQSRH